MQDPQVSYFERGLFCSRLIILFGLSALALCFKAWAVGPPSLQISRDPQASSSIPINDSQADKQPRIAIIIDDLGYSLHNGTLATKLPGPITVSILPHSPHGITLAKLAATQQKEIMLHAPMSSILDQPLDPGGLTPDMTHYDFMATLKASLDDLPNIQGVNNHMGSQLTQQHRPMAWLMAELRERDLYFVDSRTIATSLAWQTALDYGIPTTQRDIFLDNDPTYPAIAQQFGALLSLAKSRGQAIAIAHPYPETLRFLQAALPMLKLTNIHLVPVSNLLSTPAPLQNKRPILTKRAVDRPHEVVGLLNYLAE